MSLAVLKRKSQATAPRFSTNKCFVLNMTGRGGVIGQSAKTGHSVCGPLKNQKITRRTAFCTSGMRQGCCANVEYMAPDCSNCPTRWRLHKPAPQMGYGVYLNRKAKGSFRPSGYPCKDPSSCALTSKPVWKLTKTYDASLITEQRRIAALRCNKFSTPRDPVSGKITSNVKPCVAGIKQEKCDHSAKNKKWCLNITKDLGGRRSASEQIERHKADALSDVCGPPCAQTLSLHFEISGCVITLVNNNSCKPLIIRGQKYKIFITKSDVEPSFIFKIYTNISSTPTKMCDIFYECWEDKKATNKNICNVTVSSSFCPNMNPILYFEVSSLCEGSSKIPINISKAYKGYSLKQPMAGTRHCR